MHWPEKHLLTWLRDLLLHMPCKHITNPLPEVGMRIGAHAGGKTRDGKALCTPCRGHRTWCPRATQSWPRKPGNPFSHQGELSGISNTIHPTKNRESRRVVVDALFQPTSGTRTPRPAWYQVSMWNFVMTTKTATVALQ